MAEFYRVFSSSEVTRVTGLSQRQIIHLCERGIISAAIEADGIGSRRAYSSKNLLELLVVKAFFDLGIGVRKVGEVLKDLRAHPDGDVFTRWGTEWDNGVVVFLNLLSGKPIILAIPEGLKEAFDFLSYYLKKKNLVAVSAFMIFLGPLKKKFELADGKIIAIQE
jgi:DNA-binding transcriptional MerR regulator